MFDDEEFENENIVEEDGFDEEAYGPVNKIFDIMEDAASVFDEGTEIDKDEKDSVVEFLETAKGNIGKAVDTIKNNETLQKICKKLKHEDHPDIFEVPSDGDFRKKEPIDMNPTDHKKAFEESALINDHNKSYDRMLEAEKNVQGYFVSEQDKRRAEGLKIDIEEAHKEINDAHWKFDKEDKKINDMYKSGKIDDIRAEHMLRDLNKKRLQFQRKIEIKSLGLQDGWDDFAEAMEDTEFIIADAEDDGFSETRHTLREDLKNLSNRERKQRIEKIYDEGKIDGYAKNDLLSRYTW